jgi:hypothetical protein
MTANERKAAMSAIAAALKAARKYLAADQKARYGLPAPVAVTLASEGAAAPWEGRAPFMTADGTLRVEWLEPGLVRLEARAFPAESGLWNGPDLIPNKWFRSMLASLFHDLVLAHVAEIAIATGLTAAQVWKWANAVLWLVWDGADEAANGTRRTWMGRAESWLAFQTCSLGGPWYSRLAKALKRILCLTAAGVALALPWGCAGGCAALPDGALVGVEGADVINSVMQTQGDGL